MSSKMQKGALVTIVVLLVIFIPLAGSAIYFKFMNKPQEIVLENINKEFYFDNKLWFYDSDEVLLGTYNCETTNCGYASNWQSDEEYAIRSYKSEEEKNIPIIKNRFVFLKDFENENTHEAFLYDIINKTSYKDAAYSSVKNYGIGIEDNIFIIENALHKYNVAKINDVFEPLFEFDYDFIGLIESYNENDEILADYFVTLKNSIWNIMDSSGAILTEDFTEEIATFNGAYIISRDSSSNYHLMNYQNEKIIEEDFQNLSFTDRYLNCTTKTGEFYVYDLNQNRAVGDTFILRTGDTVVSKMNDEGNLDIYINDTLKDTIILT